MRGVRWKTPSARGYQVVNVGYLFVYLLVCVGVRGGDMEFN